MPELNINGRPIKFDSIEKLDGFKKKWAAREATSRDGLDHVEFKMGHDTFMASGKSMDLGGLNLRTCEAKLDGQNVTITDINNQVNSPEEEEARLAARLDSDAAAGNAFRNAADLSTTTGDAMDAGHVASTKDLPAAADYAFRKAAELSGKEP
ncbi:MAG TPA: hypothetical protein DD435_01700 [Cyanobacteria bacterium UBA8530]|nr:hypothetical protein [Cyanobacteria bacterium UBA8530]